MAKQTRRSFSVKFKLQVLSEYNEHDAQKGFRGLGKKYGIAPKQIRSWYAQREDLSNLLRSPEKQACKIRRLAGGGRPCSYPEVDRKLLEWVTDQNAKGLRMTDKYLQMQAQAFNQELNGDMQAFLEKFSASTGWLQRFKKRHNLCLKATSALK
eukprot:TRINITY_DN644_c0_g1_i1.p1 TRINITY_DN644_c0_g1~~TRINITY_DN644_c0_g1_i1.p1  ORF type:complete len:154 (+),score=11.21 TRINITY_DN644_c0_g1_i1:74-535(+)